MAVAFFFCQIHSFDSRQQEMNQTRSNLDRLSRIAKMGIYAICKIRTIRILKENLLIGIFVVTLVALQHRNASMAFNIQAITKYASTPRISL